MFQVRLPADRNGKIHVVSAVRIGQAMFVPLPSAIVDENGVHSTGIQAWRKVVKINSHIRIGFSFLNQDRSEVCLE